METSPTDASAKAQPLVVLERVEKRYGAFRPALVGLDLGIARGEFVVIEGPGGAGKSVLLRLLAGLENPSGGTIQLAGENLARLRPRALAQVRRSMGILPPADALLGARSAVENVALAAWVAGTQEQEGLRRARAALELVGLDVGRYGAAPCMRLASGQRHCVALARALVNRPALLLLDDPGVPLEPAQASRLLQVIDQFAQAGVTVIASRRADAAPAAAAQAWPARARIVRLHDGAIVP